MINQTSSSPKFVIRSMSTTDYNWRTQEPVVPYHIYLLPIEARKGAWWSTYKSGAQVFATVEAAQAEIDRTGLEGKEIVEWGYTGHSYWERPTQRKFGPNTGRWEVRSGDETFVFDSEEAGFFFLRSRGK